MFSLQQDPSVSHLDPMALPFFHGSSLVLMEHRVKVDPTWKTCSSCPLVGAFLSTCGIFSLLPCRLFSESGIFSIPQFGAKFSKNFQRGYNFIWVEIIRMRNMQFLCHSLSVFMMTWTPNYPSESRTKTLSWQV